MRTAYLALLAVAIAFGGIVSDATAQVKVGTVDLQRIRKESPEFKRALAEIEDMVSKFDKQRDDQKSNLDRLAADLRDTEQRGFRGSADRMRTELQEKSQAFQQFMEETFGTNGIIEQNSSEQLKPLYDKLAEAAKTVAQSKSLDLILDLEQVNPLFASDRLDVTDSIMAEMNRLR